MPLHIFRHNPFFFLYLRRLCDRILFKTGSLSTKNKGGTRQPQAKTISSRLHLAVLLICACASLRAQTVNVRNAGVGGENSAEGRARFEQDVLAQHPRFVLIDFGMNDAVNEPKFLPVDQFIANMAWMAKTAREHQILPVFSTVQHVDAVRVMQRHKAASYGAEGPNGRIDRFNAALRILAAQQGIALADFAHDFDAAGGPTETLSTDGVHLTPAGYALLARSFLAALPAAPHAGDTIVCLGDSLTYGVPLRTTAHDSPETYPAQLQNLVNSILTRTSPPIQSKPLPVVKPPS